MIFTETRLRGAYVIDIEPRRDSRGHFARTWCAEELSAHGLDVRVSQINTGFSPVEGTLRGMHLQLAPDLEVKLVRCTRGAIFDVIIDLRTASDTYRQWFGAELTEINARQLYVPAGCAHGYLTTLPDSEVSYMASTRYAPASATGVRFDDPAFGIRWPTTPTLISDADRSWPDFGDGSRVSVKI